MSTKLLIIDPQNDFMDTEGNRALPVLGAKADMQRLAAWLNGGVSLDEVIISMDSHSFYDIAHPAFWRKGDGSLVSGMTLITEADYLAGVYVPADPSENQWVASYLGEIKAMMVWNPHCIVGTEGHGIEPILMAALNKWQAVHNKNLKYIFKGMDYRTEHFSAIEPVMLPPNSKIALQNDTENVMGLFQNVDTLFVAGEALSHCVAETVRSIIKHNGEAFASNIWLLIDCMSSVPGFEDEGEKFKAEMKRMGVKLVTTRMI